MTGLLPLLDPPTDRLPLALARSVSVFGGCDSNARGVVQLERLAFPSLDEPMLIEMRLEQRRRAQERDRWIGRAVGAGMALCFGVGTDGFAVEDLTGAFMGGVLGDLTAEGLNKLSDKELKDLGLEWATRPESFLFHQRRHGRPLQRALVLAPGDGDQLTTSCAVRFSDGFLAFFSPEPYRCDLPLFDGSHRLSGEGAMPEPDTSATTVAELACSDGRQRPVQRLITDRGALLTMAIHTPHHSLY